ncbi:hypothetical protein PoMZ_13212 [Pyricularia oryzae]|uniref:Uncharacterized protein n=1 Tax=Pyricularia oryzae TaxID=318829 RepID=A0A4P7NUY3_PYROR|nr:hypothetical protein PoMZ_13212 [Pyricularia oryzae]
MWSRVLKTTILALHLGSAIAMSGSYWNPFSHLDPTDPHSPHYPKPHNPLPQSDSYPQRADHATYPPSPGSRIPTSGLDYDPQDHFDTQNFPASHHGYDDDNESLYGSHASHPGSRHGSNQGSRHGSEPYPEEMPNVGTGSFRSGMIPQ